MKKSPSNCGLCHTCGSKLRTVDGEEWCDSCKTYRRYNSHGWSGEERSPCISNRVTLTTSCPYCGGKLKEQHKPSRFPVVVDGEFEVRNVMLGDCWNREAHDVPQTATMWHEQIPVEEAVVRHMEGDDAR